MERDRGRRTESEKRLQEVLDKAAETLERSRHFRNGSKPYQIYLAREAAQKALREQLMEDQRRADVIDAVNRVRVRNNLTQRPHRLHPMQGNLEKKKTNYLGITDVSPLPKPEQTQSPYPLRRVKTLTSMQMHTMSSQHQQVNVHNFTIQNLRALLDKPPIDYVKGFRSRSQIAIEHRHAQGETRMLTPVAHRTKNMINLAKAAAFSPEQQYKGAAGSLIIPSDLESVSSVFFKLPLSSRPLTVTTPVAKATRSEPLLKRREVNNADQNLDTDSSPELSVALKSIMENLRIVGEDTDFEISFHIDSEGDENYDHLSNVLVSPHERRLKKNGKKLQVSSYPPGVHGRANASVSTIEVYFGHPFYTKEGDVIYDRDSDADSIAPPDDIPGPGFKNKPNLTQIPLGALEKSKKKNRREMRKKILEGRLVETSNPEDFDFEDYP